MLLDARHEIHRDSVYRLDSARGATAGVSSSGNRRVDGLVRKVVINRSKSFRWN